MLSNLSTFNSVKHASSRTLRASKGVVKHTQAYYPKRARELLQRRKTVELNSYQTSNKLRFLSLPLVAKKKLSIVRKFKSKALTRSSYLVRSELLVRKALIKRFFSRKARDLRAFGRHRKLPRNTYRRFWLQWRDSKQKLKAKRGSRYYLPEAIRYRTKDTPRWVFFKFYSLVSKRGFCPSPKLRLPAGEVCSSKPTFKRNLRKLRVSLPIIKKKVKQWTKFYCSRKVGAKKVSKRTYIKKDRKRTYRIRKKLPYYYQQSIPMEIRNSKKRFEQTLQSGKGFNYRLVSNTPTTKLLAPVYFTQPTKRPTLGTMLNGKLYSHDEVVQQEQYRKLREYSDNLPQYLPKLINFVVNRSFKKSYISRKNIINLVNTVYWNLRVRMHQKPRGKTAKLPVNRLKLVSSELSAWSKARLFTPNNLTQTRFRFQPQRLTKRQPIANEALDWMYKVLPLYYDLVEEDDEKYGHLALSVIETCRAHPAKGKVRKWKTRSLSGLMEHKFARLTNKHHIKNSSRFENALLTARRTPALSRWGAAAELHGSISIGSTATRTPFFSRFFSTTTKTSTNALVFSQLNNIRRPQTAGFYPRLRCALSNRKIKERADRRYRIFTVGAHQSVSIVSPDVRTLRAKSVRSTQFLQRLNCGGNTTTANRHLLFSGSTASRGYPRTINRKIVEHLKSSAEKRPPHTKDDRVSSSPTRINTIQPKKGKDSIKKTPIFRRLFTKNKRCNFRVTKMEIAVGSNKNALSNIIGSRARDVLTPKCIIEPNSRSILQFRSAIKRNPVFSFIRQLQITNNSIRIGVINKALDAANRKCHLGRKLLKQRVKNRGLSFMEQFIYKGALNEQQPYKRIRWTKKKRNFNTRVSNMPATPTKLNSYFYSRYTNNKETLLKKETSQWRASSVHFISKAVPNKKNKTAVSLYANRVEQKQAQTLFDRRRNKLWRDMTLKWAKKFRLVKSWLRDINLSFKNEDWMLDGDKPVLPYVLFKDLRIRLRQLEWHESDNHFDRWGLHHAYTFHPKQRRHSRWLEATMFGRSLYNIRRGEYRRYQFPREQKAKKWLQKYRKLMCFKPTTHLYIKRRRWPLIRMYSQRLHRSVFSVRSSKIALKRFRKLARRKSRTTGFEKNMQGFGNRLDVTLMLLNIAPTTFWAREMSRLGLLTVNGEVVTDPSFRFQVNDYVQWSWEKIKKLRVHFNSPLRRYENNKTLKASSLYFPKNFDYSVKLRSAHYLRLPRADDIPESSRINARLFRWNRLDSGLGR